jgi:hypothetical protein
VVLGNGNLDYAPLSAEPDRDALAAYITRSQVPGYDAATGFDEQKSPVLQHRPDKRLWRRRYRLSTFAQANGLTYAFRSDPRTWSGMVPDKTTMTDVLRYRTTSGQRVMTCAQELVRANGGFSRYSSTDCYTAVALSHGARGRSIFLRHRSRPQSDVLDPLVANYIADDPFLVNWNPHDIGQQYGFARPVLTSRLVTLILDIAPGYDLFLAGGWLYLMKPARTFFGPSVAKINADPELLKERFEIAARLGPDLERTTAA